MVTRPSILALDEPTSGLDSFNCVCLLQCLRDIANSGATVLFVIHQPSEKIFRMMDKLILLKEGRVVLQEQVKHIEATFEDNGFPSPEDEVISEWMLQVCNTKSVSELEEAGFFPKRSETSQRSTRQQSTKKDHTDLAANKNLGLLSETGLLAHREFIRRTRTGLQLLVQLLIIPVVWGALLAFTFNSVAEVNEDEPESYVEFQSHVGAMFFNFFGASIAAPTILLDFVEQRPIFEREYKSGHYGLLPYCFVAIIQDAVIVLIQGLVVNLVCFWAIGFQTPFWYFNLVYFCYGFALLSVILAAGTFVDNPDNTKEILGIVLFPQALLCGFYVAISELPAYIRWASYLVPLSYVFPLAAMAEFSYCGSVSQYDSNVLRCVQGLGLFLADEVVYTEDSVLRFQHAGIYKGNEGIREYRYLAGDSENALVNDICPISRDMELFVHEATDDGYCDMTVSLAVGGTANAKWGTGNYAIETVVGNQIKFDMVGGDNVMHTNDLFLSDPHYPGLLRFDDKEELLRQICQTLEGTCSEVGDDFFRFQSFDDCVSAFLELPDISLDDNGYYLFTGNTTGCRGIHAAMAVENPEGHCPHLSYHAQEDKNGNFKCDDRNLNQIYTNFTEEQIQTFRRIAVLNDLTEPSMSRWVDPSERKPCHNLSRESIFESVMKAEVLSSDFNPVCYQFVQSLGLGNLSIAMHWALLLLLTLSFRTLFAYGLHQRGKKQQ